MGSRLSRSSALVQMVGWFSRGNLDTLDPDLQTVCFCCFSLSLSRLTRMNSGI